jgi:hypothetical protein
MLSNDETGILSLAMQTRDVEISLSKERKCEPLFNNDINGKPKITNFSSLVLSKSSLELFLELAELDDLCINKYSFGESYRLSNIIEEDGEGSFKADDSVSCNLDIINCEQVYKKTHVLFSEMQFYLMNKTTI